MTINKVILIGRAGKDPETRYMTNGEAVTNLSLATSENYKDKAGTKQEKTEWHNLTFYKRLAEVVGEYVKKGSMIYVEGKITTRKWQDKEGKDRYTTEIICHEMKMLGGKTQGDGEQVERSTPAANPSEASSAKASFDDFDDDIPFN
jgi:single-strand DNA-binding protein